MTAAGSILDVIGRTPAVWLDRMTAARGLEGRILAKLEYLNPGFSKKDRAALGIIRAAPATMARCGPGRWWWNSLPAIWAQGLPSSAVRWATPSLL